jgi:hypothetical protein
MIPPLSAPIPAASPHAPAPQSLAAQLPDDVLGLIVAKLNVEDRLTAGKVCRRWRRSARSPALWQKQLAALPQSPAALRAGMALVAGLCRPTVEAGMAGGCIVGRNQRDLQQAHHGRTGGSLLASDLHLPRPPNSALIGLSLEGFPYRFGPEQHLVPLAVPPFCTLPLPPLPPNLPAPYRPLPEEADLTPLVIEWQLMRQWQRFHSTVLYVVPKLEVVVQQSLARNRRAVAAMHLQATANMVDLQRALADGAAHPKPSMQAQLRAYQQELAALEVTALFLKNFSSYSPPMRWHVYPPRWLMVALSHGWLDRRPRGAQVDAGTDTEASTTTEPPLFHYVGAGPPPSPRRTPASGP